MEISLNFTIWPINVLQTPKICSAFKLLFKVIASEQYVCGNHLIIVHLSKHPCIFSILQTYCLTKEKLSNIKWSSYEFNVCFYVTKWKKREDEKFDFRNLLDMTMAYSKPGNI